MPLSWLPLISDYTREAAKPVRATVASVVTYGIVSAWMYLIGMGAAIFTAESDIAQIMVKAGLGIAGLLIIVFYCYDNISGCIFCGSLQRVYYDKIQCKMDCCRCCSHRCRSGYLFAALRYHRFSILYRFCICADDCNSNCGFLYDRKRCQPDKIPYSKFDHLVGGLYHLSLANEDGYYSR